MINHIQKEPIKIRWSPPRQRGDQGVLTIGDDANAILVTTTAPATRNLLAYLKHTCKVQVDYGNDGFLDDEETTTARRAMHEAGGKL